MPSDKKDSSVFTFSGNHVLAEFYGVEESLLDNENYLCNILKDAVETCGASILDIVSHKFSPEGVTALLLLSESHASIHTYPKQYAAFIDIFTCGDCKPEIAVQEIQKALNPKSFKIKHITRGE